MVLYGSNGTVVATTVTDGSGNYSFGNLPPGSYTIVETDLPGYLSTGDTQGGNDNQIAVTLTSEWRNSAGKGRRTLPSPSGCKMTVIVPTGETYPAAFIK